MNANATSRDFAVTKVAAGVTVDRVSCDLSSRHNRRAHPDSSVEDEIDRVWQNRLDSNPNIFNGCKFRLKAMKRALAADSKCSGMIGLSGGGGTTAPMIALELGLTDYRSYLGTNASILAKDLVKDGLDAHGDGDAFLSMKLGVGGVTRTADGFLAFIVRSSHVAEAQGMVDVPGGHPEPERVGLPHAGHLSILDLCGKQSVDNYLCEEATKEIFKSVVEEVVAETNAPRETLCGGVGIDSSRGAILLGMVNQLPTAGTPSLAFGILCSLTSTELDARYKLGAEEAEESVELMFVSELDLTRRVEFAEKTIEECALATLCFERDVIAPRRFTPSTRGCITLWLAHTLGIDGD